MTSALLLRVNSYTSDDDDEDWRPLTPPPSSPGQGVEKVADDDDTNNAKNNNSSSSYLANFVHGVQYGFLEASPTEMISSVFATVRTLLIVLAIGFVRMGREGTLLLHHSMVFMLSCLVYMLQRERNTAAATYPNSNRADPGAEEEESTACTLHLSSSPSTDSMTDDDPGGIAIV